MKILELKRVIGCVAISAAFSLNAIGQHKEAGIPWSNAILNETVISQRVGTLELQSPDFASYIQEDLDHPERFINKPYRSGIGVAANFDLNNSGTFTYLKNGDVVWRLQIKLAGSQAIDIFYDKFTLPEGVKFFVSNGNGRQLLGAYTHLNNNDNNNFSHAMVQGDVVNLEMNIPAYVNISKIDFHGNEVVGNYRSAEAITRKYTVLDNAVEARPTGFGDANACTINASCPEGTGYDNLKHTVARIYIPSGGGAYGWCTGNLINNTNKDCAPLFLTASHCDAGNGTTNAHFAAWKFYFNYETPNCDGTGTVVEDNIILGAEFKARSFYPGDDAGMAGDFLLLKLKDATFLNDLGNNYNAYLAGWSKTGLSSEDTKWINFSHPAGDVMKVTNYRNLRPNGNFLVVDNSHWLVNNGSGGTEGGSSGSGLFLANKGWLIGDLSGITYSGAPPPACDTNAANQYSKISRNWEYPEGDGTASSQLKNHLDPAGTGASNMNTIKVAATGETCGGVLSISDAEELNDGTNVYPNPSTGAFNIKVNLPYSSDVNISVVNVLGAQFGTFSAPKVQNGQDIKLDLTNLAAGVYFLNINTNKATTTKRIVILK